MPTSLREIPGMGERMETHFRNIGVSCVEELVGRSPEELSSLTANSRASATTRARSTSSVSPYITLRILCATPRSSNGGTGRIKLPARKLSAARLIFGMVERKELLCAHLAGPLSSSTITQQSGM